MYRSCTGHVSTVLTCIVMCRRGPCIAGPIHDRYMGIFWYVSVFFCVFGWPLRYAPIHASARIHAKYSKIQQNTFGEILTLDLGEIAPKPMRDWSMLKTYSESSHTAHRRPPGWVGVRLPSHLPPLWWPFTGDTAALVARVLCCRIDKIRLFQKNAKMQKW